MKPFLIPLIVFTIVAAGCRPAASPEPRGPARTAVVWDVETARTAVDGLPSRPADSEHMAGRSVRQDERYVPAFPHHTPIPDRGRLPDEGRCSRPPEAASPRLALDGIFIPSGWMGDGADPDGPLRREVCRREAFSPPACEKWIYAPAGPTRNDQGWIAVAYQGPQANNWGAHKGVDLNGRGFTRLTFMARGERGGELILVRSGGCTAPGARYPASYETTIGMIALEREWKQFEVPLDGLDLSNTCSVLSFVLDRAAAPDGAVFYLDDITLSGSAPE